MGKDYNLRIITEGKKVREFYLWNNPNEQNSLKIELYLKTNISNKRVFILQ